MAAAERHIKKQNLPDDAELNEAIFLTEICGNLTRTVQGSKELKERTKGDCSPVTKADLAVQALVTLYLQETRQRFNLCAEEDSSQVKDEEMLLAVTALVNEHFPFSVCPDRESFTTEDITSALDNADADTSKVNECWVMDPIDGTRGFVRYGQYAVALGKIKDGGLELAVVCSPNVPAGRPFTDLCTYDAESDSHQSPGYNSEQTDASLLAALRGHGCRETRFEFGSTGLMFEGMDPINVSNKTALFEFNFCESVNFPPPSQAKTARLVSAADNPMYQLDSMAKYSLVAAGEMDCYLRFSGMGRQKIWDHVGELLVIEAGGMVTDVNGKRLNFTVGKKLTENIQIVASNGKCHQAILDVAEAVLKGEGSL